MSREGKLVKNTLILAIGTFFPKLATFVTLPVLTAYLTQAEYGSYDLVLTLVSLVLPAATLQIHSAAFRFLLDNRDNESEKESIISNIYGFILPVSVVALIIMAFVLRGQDPMVRVAICVYFFFDIIVRANRQIIRGLSRNKDYAVSAFISSVGQILLIVLLVMGFRQGLLGALLALAAAETISSLYLMFKGRIYKYIRIGSISGAKLKELLAYSWPMVPNTLSLWVMQASDRLIISAFLGVAANAVFSVAYKIPSILSFAQMTFNMAWQENASIVSKDEDAAKYYSTMFTWLFNIISGGMSALLGMTPILFDILIQGNYAEAYVHIPIIFMGMLFYSLSSFWGGIFVAFKKTKSVGTSTVVSAALHLFIVLAGIHFFGLYAASVATAVGYLILCAMRLIGVQKVIKLDYDWKHICAICALLVLQCGLCMLQNTAVNVVNFVVGIVVCVLLNRQLIRNIFSKVFRKLGKR